MSEKWYFFASASKYIREMESSRTLLKPDAWIAPCKMDLDGSGMISSGSASSRVPRPVQIGHAPKGLLNENIRGLSSGILTPQSSQA